jgi:hypothetical protein
VLRKFNFDFDEEQLGEYLQISQTMIEIDFFTKDKKGYSIGVTYGNTHLFNNGWKTIKVVQKTVDGVIFSVYPGFEREKLVAVFPAEGNSFDITQSVLKDVRLCQSQNYLEVDIVGFDASSKYLLLFENARRKVWKTVINDREFSAFAMECSRNKKFTCLKDV